MKIENLFSRKINSLRLVYLKLIFSQKIIIGKRISLKNTSRIKLWDSNGEISVGNDFSIGYNSELYVWNNKIKIGNNTSINDNCKIYANVTIGANCLFASNIFISSGTHNFGKNPYLPIKTQDSIFPEKDAPIIIEDDCWIGFGVVVMPGVYIGKGAIIGSNSVVTKDVIPYTINGGVPCKEIGKRVEFLEGITIGKLDVNKPEHWPFFYRGVNYKQFEDIESVSEGVKIIENNSMFLLGKKKTNKIEVIGTTNTTLYLEMVLDNKFSLKKVIKKGDFDIKLCLNNDYYGNVDTYEGIPESIKTNFSIIEMKVEGSMLKSKDSIFKLKSIGYYED